MKKLNKWLLVSTLMLTLLGIQPGFSEAALPASQNSSNFSLQQFWGYIYNWSSPWLKFELPATTPAPAPQPKQEPTPAPQPAPQSKPVPQPTPAPQPAPVPQPKPVPQPAPTTQPAPAVKGLTAEEQQMVDLVNQERTSRGLQPLKVDMTLVKLARMKSQDMIDHNYFDHISPTYGSPADMLKNYGVAYWTMGENIAGHYSVTGAHQGLMNSEGHRKNILSPDFNYIGIGIIDGGPYGKMFTQEFVGR